MTKSLQYFLLGYCQELTGLRTTSLKAFAKAVQDGCPRAKEAVLLLALAQDREEYLMRVTASGEVRDECRAFAAAFREANMALPAYVQMLPKDNRYHKVIAAWESDNTQLQRDRKTLERVARGLNNLIQEKGLTRAQACRAARVDKGNFYAFLKGDVARLSRQTAIDAYRAIEAL